MITNDNNFLSADILCFLLCVWGQIKIDCSFIPFLLFIWIICSDLRGEMLSRAKRYVTVSCPVHLLLFLCIENSTKFWMFSLCSFLSPRSTLYLVFYPPTPSPDNANFPCDDCLCARDPTKFAWTWGRCAAAHFSLPDAHLSPLIPQDASQWGKCEACFCDVFQWNASLVGTLAPSVWTFPGSSIRCPCTDIAGVTHIPVVF